METKSRIKYPYLFQGKNKNKNYFEGWYYKHVGQNENNVLTVIPGINYEDKNKSAFIQIIIGPEFKSYYIDYDYDDFSWSDNPFCINIGPNSFKLDEINLNIDKQGLSLNGTLKYTNLSPLDTSILNPNIMGYFAYIKWMQCNHGVISLDHDIKGTITYMNNDISFDNGKGYIEKDWGTSFPKEYCWIQCNNFNEPSVSLSLSIAHIPFAMNSFRGLICVLKIGETQYRFATYNGSKIVKLEKEEDILYIVLKRNNITLEIKAQIKDGLLLKAPRNGVMQDDIYETLSGEVEVSLYQSEDCFYSSNGNKAGIELVNLI